MLANIEMKNRDIIFFGTAVVVFSLTWLFFTTILNVAQGVGDTPAEFNPVSRSGLISAVLTFAYGVIYYGIYWLIVVIKKFTS